MHSFVGHGNIRHVVAAQVQFYQIFARETSLPLQLLGQMQSRLQCTILFALSVV